MAFRSLTTGEMYKIASYLRTAAKQFREDATHLNKKASVNMAQLVAQFDRQADEAEALAALFDCASQSEGEVKVTYNVDLLVTTEKQT